MTYSLVARDASTGEMGVAVQSHWFSVGSIVSWAQPGVGAVATQSIAEPAYGPRLLERLGAGAVPGEALEQLLSEDEEARFRQVAVVDATGRVAAHTGSGCIEHAGQVEGDGFSAQANMMRSPEVWPAMAAAFEGTEGPLARRLLAALYAGEGAGGDVRGRQSASLVVVAPRGEPWARDVELRVEDHPEPLAELRRLLDLHEAYALATDADDLVGEGRHSEAGELYRRASEVAPDNHELLFWSGLAIAESGELDEGTERVRRAIQLEPGWAELLPRLDPEIAPGADAVRERLASPPPG
jgi:uncharacterized Ntn-hydrolase superfamily protein